MVLDWGMQDVGSFVETRHSSPYPAILPSATKLPKSFTVCIVGASRGIGAGIATAYAHAGATGLILASRRVSGLQETASACRAINPTARVEIVECDICEPTAVQALATHVETAFGGALDVVVVNSGFSGNVELTVVDTNPATFQQAINVNYVGTFLVAKYLIPILLRPNPTNAAPVPLDAGEERPSKSFIAVSSLGTLIVRGPIANAQYCVSKLAQLKLMENIHEQYLHPAEGRTPFLNAFSVHPGAVASEMALDSAPKDFLVHLTDSPELCGAFCVWLTKDQGKGRGRQWLSGRLVSALWDVGELELKKGQIEEGDLLKIGMSI